MNTGEILLTFFIGTLFGSFFYTLAIRFIQGKFKESPVRALVSPSSCQACGKRISPLYLFPILGYCALKGKCGNCSAPISPLYPAAEIVYGILLILFVNQYGRDFYAFNLFLIGGLALCISVIDLKSMKIPDPLVAAFVILSAYPVALNGSIRDTLFGALVMFIFFLVVLLIFPGSFGGGDIKFASAIGFFLGLEMTLVALEASLITGALAGVLYAVITRRGLKTKIPFGPFLCAGLFIALFYGKDLILIYYRWVY